MSNRDEQLRSSINAFCQLQKSIDALKEQMQNAAPERKKQLETQIKQIQWHQKKSRNALFNEYDRLPGLKTLDFHIIPVSKISQIEQEYADIFSEVKAEFFNLVCQDFQPILLSFTDSLVVYINEKLRLKYKVLELMPSREGEHWRKLVKLLEKNGNYITVREFAVATKLYEDKAREYLEEHAILSNATISTNEIGESLYYFYRGLRKTSEEELAEQAKADPLELDKSTGTDQPLSDSIPEKGFRSTWDILTDVMNSDPNSNVLTWGQRLIRSIRVDSDKKLQNSHPPKRPDCNCQVLIQRSLSEFEDSSKKFRQIAISLDIEYKRLYAHYTRNCIPLLLTIIIELSDQNNLRQHIEDDPGGKFQNLHLDKYPEITCKLLASRLLSIFQNPPIKLGDLAKKLEIETQDLKKFWENKCLFVLSRAAINIEEEM